MTPTITLFRVATEHGLLIMIAPMRTISNVYRLADAAESRIFRETKHPNNRCAVTLKSGEHIIVSLEITPWQ